MYLYRWIFLLSIVASYIEQGAPGCDNKYNAAVTGHPFRMYAVVCQMKSHNKHLAILHHIALTISAD